MALAQGCSDSMEYMLLSNTTFEYQTYYANFCSGFSREQVETKLREDLEGCLFDIRSTLDNETEKWLREQLDNDIPLLKDMSVDAFWIQMEEQRQFMKSTRHETVRKGIYMDKLHTSIINMQTTPSGTNSLVAEKMLNDHNVMEADSTFFIDGRSIGSILKSNGKRLLHRYNKLDPSQKAECAYSLNGILDLSESSLQKDLFTADQWEAIKNYFTNANRRTHPPHLSKITQEAIQKIRKNIDSGAYLFAYYKCLKYIPMANADEQWLLKILAHVLNCYNERSQIFQESGQSTEGDYMAKLWYELFELIFGQAKEYLKWGESVPNVTTAIKLVNNDNKPNTIGCKIDGRVLIKTFKTQDVCHIEASKGSSLYNKTELDKAKLAIETKCVLDDVLLKSSESSQAPYHQVPNVQLFGHQAAVRHFQLVDAGLYIYTSGYDLSLPSDILEFSKMMVEWSRRLKRFKYSCHHTSTIHGSASKIPSNKASNWVRGTFIIPASGPAILPKNFLCSPNGSTAELKETADFKVSILGDGTEIRERLLQQAKKCRKSKQTVKDNTGRKKRRAQAYVESHPKVHAKSDTKSHAKSKPHVNFHTKDNTEDDAGDNARTAAYTTSRTTSHPTTI